MRLWPENFCRGLGLPVDYTNKGLYVCVKCGRVEESRIFYSFDSFHTFGSEDPHLFEGWTYIPLADERTLRFKGSGLLVEGDYEDYFDPLIRECALNITVAQKLAYTQMTRVRIPGLNCRKFESLNQHEDYHQAFEKDNCHVRSEHLGLDLCRYRSPPFL